MPEYENPEAGWGLETDAQEPIQVDAGYDDDCCNEIRRLFLGDNQPSDFDEVDPTTGEFYSGQEFWDKVNNADCETLLRWIGNTPLGVIGGGDPDNPNKTLQDVYNECVAGKMPQGGDFTMGEPIDLAWRLLKHG